MPEVVNTIQPSFAAGELSPQLYARVDLAKYRVGLALMRNFFVDYRGGASTRPGMMFVGQAKQSDSAVRLLPFQFNVEQTYVLEFSDFAMRVIMDGGYVLETEKNITNISQSDPGVVTSASHGYSNGDWVFIESVDGMAEVNGRTFIVANQATNTFELTDLNGEDVDTSGFAAYTANGIVSRVYTEDSPFAAEDLALVKFTQSADVMTLVHPDYAPQDLTRTGHAAWTFTAITFASSIAAPGGPTVAATGAGTTHYSYKVTAVTADGEESVASTAGVDSGDDISSVAGRVDISWSAVAGASTYRVYKAQPIFGAAVAAGAPHGFAGSTTGITFIDGNIIQDFTRSPPLATNPLLSNNPGTVAYFKQRKVFGGSNDFPQTIWMTQPGAFDNMDVRNPVTDGDAITITLVSQQVNAIKAMLPIVNGLVVLTGNSAWQVVGGPLTPSNVEAQPQAYNGASDVPPLLINYDILYIAAKGNSIRDLEYNFFANIYTGKDISVLANHFFFGYQIREWCWAEEPFKLVWVVRNDGVVLTLTYLKEQDVYGMASHDTLGEFESVTSIVEGTEDAVYFVVRRWINGHFVKYVERLASRRFTNGVESAWCVDSGLQYPLTFPAAEATVTIDGDTATIVADAAVFSAGNIGDIVRVGRGKAEVTTFTSVTEIEATIIDQVDDYITGVPFVAEEGEWSMTTPVTTVSGLHHLIGETAKILADGNVQPDQVVAADGTLTLLQPATLITAGLGFQCQMQTLPLTLGEEGQTEAKSKNIPGVTVKIADSRGLSVGPTFAELFEFPERTGDVPMGQPVPLLTQDEYFNMLGTWTVEGQYCIQQDHPLPATVLGVIPEVMIGDD